MSAILGLLWACDYIQPILGQEKCTLVSTFPFFSSGIHFLLLSEKNSIQNKSSALEFISYPLDSKDWMNEHDQCAAVVSVFCRRREATRPNKMSHLLEMEQSLSLGFSTGCYLSADWRDRKYRDFLMVLHTQQAHSTFGKIGGTRSICILIRKIICISA